MSISRVEKHAIQIPKAKFWILSHLVYHKESRVLAMSIWKAFIASGGDISLRAFYAVLRKIIEEIPADDDIIRISQSSEGLMIENVSLIITKLQNE